MTLSVFPWENMICDEIPWNKLLSHFIEDGKGEPSFNLFYHFRTLQNRMINYREEEKRILDEILGKGVYDNRIRPSGTNGTGWNLNLTRPKVYLMR